MFSVGDKVKYFYTYPDDECTVVGIEGADYRVKRRCADGAEHEFIISGDRLRPYDNKQLDFGYADTDEAKHEHTWKEYFGIGRSLGWSCSTCDMRKEDWERERRLIDNEKKEEYRKANSREWQYE